ncbi:sulfurtransferase TusA family protein [Nitrospirota bacterium]
MATEELDLRGLKCPQPTLKMTLKVIKMGKGELLEVMADCDTFESDLKSWSQRSKKTVLWVRDEGTFKRCQVQV